MKKLLCLVFSAVVGLPSIGLAQCIQGNCYDGRGTYVYPSGAKYQGQFRQGKINGEGVLYFSNGNRYSGQWVDHYRQGEGRLVFTNGDVYEGHFRRSKFHGKGVLDFANGDRYTGQWADDVMHGQGSYDYHNGDRYEGWFRQGKLHGKGTMYYHDGDRFVGHWKNNLKSGQGTYYRANGKKISGTWTAGKIHRDQITSGSAGIATASTSTTQIEAGTAPTSSSGQLNCNNTYCHEGQGAYTYGDGTKWVGYFRNGQPEGEGVCYYANGDKYVGGWERHAPHGEGIMYYTNGRVVGALWEYGSMVKKIEAENAPVTTEAVAVDYNSSVKIWAVVIGVARYDHMPVLKYTDDDAYQIYAFLKSPEGGALPDEQIRVLVDDDATRENIIKSMRQLFLQADDNDVVMVYFSGHGLPGSFLPFDFDGFNNKLYHDDIKQVFEETNAKHKLCLADACHSGTMLAMRAPLNRTLQNYYEAFENSSGGTALLLSSKGDEYSLEDMGLRQGIFSHFLIRGLKGEADLNRDKIISVQELYDFVSQKVRAYTANAQSPTLSGNFDPNMPVGALRY
ncbi:MAG: caspase family protein [Bacteroidota bacterium]